MSSAVTAVPAESDWLCEGCGYVLTGLPAGGRCPECGQATEDSAADLRGAPDWERPESGTVFTRFVSTSLEVLFHPTRFYRRFATRSSRRSSARFAQLYWCAVSVLVGMAAWGHFDWFLGFGLRSSLGFWAGWPLGIALVFAYYLMLVLGTRLAARLTTWEASYRGLRLPLNVVLRGLDYHAAHYLPVAALAAFTVFGYRLLVEHHPTLAMSYAMTYLYILCGEVIVSAAYLFRTYWIAMRNMMYASR